MVDYFLMDEPGFGRLSWLLLFGWLILLGTGAYLYSMWQERSPVRMRYFRQLGLGLSVLSAVGVLLLLLKAFGIPVLSWRLWTYLTALLTVLFAGWSFWFYRARLPRLMAATGRGGVTARRAAPPVRRTARTYGTNGSSPSEAEAPPAPRPLPTTGRREARRDKKRKSR
jgi:hypothetical protein